MSIVLSLRRCGQVAILTDGAALNPDGTLAWVGRKVVISGKFPVAVAARGNAYWGKKVSRLIVSWVEQWGFDRGMQLLSDLMPQFAPKDLPYDIVEVLIAGVSETEGPTHRFFVNVANFGIEALSLIDPGPTCWMSLETGADEGFEALGIRPPYAGELAGGYFLETGVRFMDFYRKFASSPVANSGRDYQEMYQFGGQVDLTLIDHTGVTINTIHHWPDKIGSPIDPFAGQNVTPLTGNRRERRAEKRRAA